MVLGIKPRASQVLSKHSTAEPPLTHPGHPKGSGLEAELSGTTVVSKAQMQGPRFLRDDEGTDGCSSVTKPTLTERPRKGQAHTHTHVHTHTCTRASDNTYSHGVEEVGSPLTALEGLQRRRRC